MLKTAVINAAKPTFTERRQALGLSVLGMFAANALFLVLKYLVAPLVRIIWVGKVEGLEHLPKTGACIVASNHGSYLDFMCFWSVAPRQVQYLAAEVFYKSPFWRPIMVATGQIRVDRNAADKSVVRHQAHAILKNEGMLAIFPEGTRTRTGELGRAYPGVTRFALEARVPIVPMGIIGAHEAWPPHRTLPRLQKVHIKIEKPIHHHEHYDKQHTEELVRHLTDALMHQIARLSGQEYKHAAIPVPTDPSESLSRGL